MRLANTELATLITVLRIYCRDELDFDMEEAKGTFTNIPEIERAGDDMERAITTDEQVRAFLSQIDDKLIGALKLQ
jgi:hypothetical protein